MALEKRTQRSLAQEEPILLSTTSAALSKVKANPQR